MSENESPIALLRLGRSNDVSALSSLLDCFRPYVWRFFLGRGLPSDDADDAAQNTLWHFLRSPLLRSDGPSLEEWTDARVFLYIHKIAVNVFNDYVKSSIKRAEVPLDAHLEQLNQTLREDIDVLELARAVRQRLESEYKDPRLLIVFDRRFRDGVKQQDIADEIHVSIGTVHNWLEDRIKPAIKSVYEDMVP